MKDNSNASLEPSPEQVLYANVLAKGMYVGLLCLFVTFALYVSGTMASYIPKEDLSKYWSMPVDEYLDKTEIEPGWAWVSMVGYGDFVNFIGIALLAGVTIVCYLAIVPSLIKSKDWVYAGLAMLEALVLTVAASGILGAGGH